MLDDRKAAILRAVVEVYIDTAQPVGSSHVVRSAPIDVSSATVRNEMAALEREGFLVQPHTSAGRIPTDKGYRFFVDNVAPGSLGPAQRQQVRDFFAHAHGELEQMLAETSRLLSNVTDHTAVVVGPPFEAASIRSIQLVGLGGRTVLLVAVLSNGSVEKRTLDLGTEFAEDRLSGVSAHLSAHLLGHVLADAATKVIAPTGDPVADEVVAAAAAALRPASPDEGEHVFVGGAARTAASFEAVHTVREVLDILEQQLVIVTLLRDVLDRGLSVAIGAETGLPPLAECSVVVAPYEIEGEPAGTIGILGPTRMNYPQAMAAVAAISQRLGRRLSEG
jgi:heat-inducible transcriptional repressor